MRNPVHQPTDALTSALKDAALCGFIVAAILIGSRIDRTAELEDAQHAERVRQAQVLQAARQAYQQGLDDGAERERFARQRFLAAMEQQP